MSESNEDSNSSGIEIVTTTMMTVIIVKMVE